MRRITGGSRRASSVRFTEGVEAAEKGLMRKSTAETEERERSMMIKGNIFGERWGVW